MPSLQHGLPFAFPQRPFPMATVPSVQMKIQPQIVLTCQTQTQYQYLGELSKAQEPSFPTGLFTLLSLLGIAGGAFQCYWTYTHVALEK